MSTWTMADVARRNNSPFICPARRPAGRLRLMALESATKNESDDDLRLVERARGGGASAAAGEALVRHRDRLRRMVEARRDRRIRGRVDPSDVLQDGFADAVS